MFLPDISDVRVDISTDYLISAHLIIIFYSKAYTSAPNFCFFSL